jgi:peptidoglycan-associated lipoprotein
MNEAIQKVRYRWLGMVVSLMLLPFFIGCSGQTAAKPQESSQPQKVEAKQEPAKPLAAKPSQESSLEALQKGTLGKGGDQGPLRDVNFDFDRADLRPDARDILKSNAAWLKANPQAKVEIEGHCDARGTNEYNLALGAKRAESVKRYLMDLGISPNVLSTISYG